MQQNFYILFVANVLQNLEFTMYIGVLSSTFVFAFFIIKTYQGEEFFRNENPR